MSYKNVLSNMSSCKNNLKLYLRTFIEFNGFKAYEELKEKGNNKSKHNNIKNVLFLIKEILKKFDYNVHHVCLKPLNVNHTQEWLSNIDNCLEFSLKKIEDTLKDMNTNCKLPLRFTTIVKHHTKLVKKFEFSSRSEFKGEYNFFESNEFNRVSDEIA